MRPPIPFLLVAALVAGAGCTTAPAGKSPVAAKPAAAPAAETNGHGGAPNGRRVVSVYFETTAETRPGFGNELSAAVPDELRRRGYEVRGAIAVPAGTPANDTVAVLFAPARALAGGAALDGTLRAATYLHANSPRLVFVLSLQLAAAPAKSGQPGPAVTLGAFLCETATGDVVWSGTAATAGDALDAPRARQLAAELLRSLPAAVVTKR